MIEFRRPVADDFRQIKLQASEASLQPFLGELADNLQVVADLDEYALTCLQDGVVKGIGGVLLTGEAWTMLAEDSRTAFPAIVRMVRSRIAEYLLTHDRVWSTIAKDQPNGARWAAALGMINVGGDVWEVRR